MPHLRAGTFGALAMMALSADSAFAQAGPPQGSELVRALTACRAVIARDARLACYDAAAGRLETAERTGEVVVVDREQARAARRQAFGLSLPSLNIFNRGLSDDEVSRLSVTISRASLNEEGKWVLRTEDGQVWRQTDSGGPSRAPRAGSRAEIRRAAVGSFFMNVDGQRAIRVRRQE